MTCFWWVIGSQQPDYNGGSVYRFGLLLSVIYRKWPGKGPGWGRVRNPPLDPERVTSIIYSNNSCCPQRRTELWFPSTEICTQPMLRCPDRSGVYPQCSAVHTADTWFILAYLTYGEQSSAVNAAYIQPTLYIHFRYTAGALQFDLGGPAWPCRDKDRSAAHPFFAQKDAFCGE